MAAVGEEASVRNKLQEEQQAVLDGAFARLSSNDPVMVWWAVSTALAALPLNAVVIDVDGARLDIGVIYPGPQIVREVAPKITPSGRPSSRRRTQTERNELYTEAISSAALAAARVAAETASAIERVRVLVTISNERGEPILAADFRRPALGTAALRPSARDALSAADELVVAFTGRTNAAAVMRREGLVDELMSRVESAVSRAPAEGSNPFDRGALEQTRAETAAAFMARIASMDTLAALMGNHLGVKRRSPGA